MLTSGVGAIIWGVDLNGRVKALEVRVDERIKGVETRLDKIEASIAKILEQTRPAPK